MVMPAMYAMRAQRFLHERGATHEDLAAVAVKLEQAGIGPADLNVVELHDAFTVAELVYYEALGLCGPGEAVGFFRSGTTTYGGQVVVNPSGGLLSKGHPVGASGVAQVVESYWHLTGQAGARQVPSASWAMTHVTGGGIAGLDHGSCAVHVLQRVQQM